MKFKSSFRPSKSAFSNKVVFSETMMKDTLPGENCAVKATKTVHKKLRLLMLMNWR